MIKQTRNRIVYLAIPFFTVLFLLFYAATHQSSIKPNEPIPIQYQLVCISTSAVSSKYIPQLTSLKKFVSLIDGKNYKLNNWYLKIISDNRIINQRIVFLHKVELIFKPPPRELYYFIKSSINEDYPILS